jgi:phage baseplate assembly protein V
MTLEWLKNKIYLLIGRGVLTAINNSGKTQKIQVKALHNETITDIDRVQPWGLETYPSIDGNSEVVIVFPNGNRDKGIAIAIGNREDRPKTLNPGETTIYDKNGNEIKLTATGIEIKLGPTCLELKLNSGDASLWIPNILPNDPMTGMPHGGPLAGIAKLKGA